MQFDPLRNLVGLDAVQLRSAGQQALGQLEDALQIPLGLPISAWQTAPRATHAND